MRSRIIAVPTALTTLLVLSSCMAPPDGAASDEEDSGFTEAELAAAEELGIDLEACPTDITAPLPEEVKIGMSLPLTGGVASAYAMMGDGMRAGIAEANDADRVGVNFEVVVRDDQFLPDRTLAIAQELIQRDGIDIMSSGVGTAGVLAMRDTISEECVPGLGLSVVGNVASDPAYPFLLQGIPGSSLDTRVWAQWLDDTYPDGADVAIISTNSETGQELVEGFKYWLEETASPSGIVAEETVEITEAGAPASQVTTMRATGADVVLSAVTGAQCPALVMEIVNQGWEPEIFLQAACGTSEFLAGAGDAAAGVLTTQSSKTPESPDVQDDDAFAEVVDTILRHQPQADVNSRITLNGFVLSEVILQAAEEAESSELGLSRLGLLYAARHLSFQPVPWLDGVPFSVDGLEDMIPVESGVVGRWDPATISYETVATYDFDGELSH